MRYQKRITHAALITMIVISAAGILGWVRSYADTPRVLRENPDSFIRSRMNECFANGGRNNCYRDIARELLERLSPKEILASFEAQESSPDVLGMLSRYRPRADVCYGLQPLAIATPVRYTVRARTD